VTTHRLKTWPSEWEAVRSGEKPFEVRATHDRDFAVDDRLQLDEWDPEKGGTIHSFGYSGRVLTARVSYVLHGGRLGLPEKTAVLGLAGVNEWYRDNEGKLIETPAATRKARAK
jgi:hypothetical protein